MTVEIEVEKCGALGWPKADRWDHRGQSRGVSGGATPWHCNDSGQWMSQFAGRAGGGYESEVAGGGATHVPGCARERRGRQSQSALQWTTTSRDRIRHTAEGETEAHA